MYCTRFVMSRTLNGKVRREAKVITLALTGEMVGIRFGGEVGAESSGVLTLWL